MGQEGHLEGSGCAQSRAGTAQGDGPGPAAAGSPHPHVAAGFDGEVGQAGGLQARGGGVDDGTFGDAAKIQGHVPPQQPRPAGGAVELQGLAADAGPCRGAGGGRGQCGRRQVLAAGRPQGAQGRRADVEGAVAVLAQILREGQHRAGLWRDGHPAQVAGGGLKPLHVAGRPAGVAVRGHQHLEPVHLLEGRLEGGVGKSGLVHQRRQNNSGAHGHALEARPAPLGNLAGLRAVVGRSGAGTADGPRHRPEGRPHGRPLQTTVHHAARWGAALAAARRGGKMGTDAAMVVATAAACGLPSRRANGAAAGRREPEKPGLIRSSAQA